MYLSSSLWEVSNPHLLNGITIWGNVRREPFISKLKLQKRAARLSLDESTSTPSAHFFQRLEWISINNIIKMRKILLVICSLRSSSPSELRNLFYFSCKAHNVFTRCSLTDLRVTLVKSELAKTKLSYSGVFLFNFLLNDLKIFNNYSPSAYKLKLKEFFCDLK